MPSVSALGASQFTHPTSSHSTEPTFSQPKTNEPSLYESADDKSNDDDNYLTNPEPHNEFVGVDEEY